nr:SGNH/GDSL hydrolase family protein [Acholeplasmatales bacterium]
MKKVYIIFFLCFLSFSFFGCKKKEEIIASVEDNIEAINHVNPPKVCVLGDSIAYGFNILDRKQVSGAIFTDKIEGEYVNYAVVGDTSTEMLELLHKKTNDIENKDIYIISIGANNILSYLEDVFVDEIVSLYAAFFRSNEDEIKQEFLKMIRLLDNEEMDYYIQLEINQFRLDLPNIIDYLH